MSISIITPHYNDFDGLERIYTCLRKQNISNWEWIIVDDFSDSIVQTNIEAWERKIDDSRVRLIKNLHKSNASVCRNEGLEMASNDHLVFLDSDDIIANDFVANRVLSFEEFAIFPNFNIVDESGLNNKRQLKIKQDLLNKFLSAQFLWQTSCIVWNKTYLIKIGKFDPNLERLQDVELFIRALIFGKSYKIIDNTVDFYYCTKAIKSKFDIVRKSCTSVDYLILKISTNYKLSGNRNSLIKAYYYACVKSLHRSKIRKDVVYVKRSLKQFYNLNYINIFEYSVGFVLLILYQYRFISDLLFINFNRYFFKKKC